MPGFPPAPLAHRTGTDLNIAMVNKKSSKGKEKKLARKAENERAAAVEHQVRALNESSARGAALAVQFPAFQQYNRSGVDGTLKFYGSSELPPPLLDWALALTRQHMAALYDACPGWGWNDGKKRAELADPAARYLVLFLRQPTNQNPAEASQQQGAVQGLQQEPGAKQQEEQAGHPCPGSDREAAACNGGCNSAAGDQPQQGQQQRQQGEQAAGAASTDAGRPIAFLHFRFEVEAGEAVVYCYEIQVAEDGQGKGVGRFLMQLLELIARNSGVARLMLTVFHGNRAAVALYTKLGYVLDALSPGAIEPSGQHRHEIMTKWLHPRNPT